LTGGGMVAAGTSIAIVRLFQVVWFGWRSARIQPQFRLQIGLFSFRELRRLAPSGFAFFAYSSGNAVINQGAVLAVQSSMGPIAVVHFNVARQLGRVFLQLMGLVFSSVHPEMNLAFARRDFVRMASLQARALTPLLWSSPIVVILVYCCGPYVAHLWTHGKVSIAPIVLGLFAIDALAYGISGTALLAAWSSNRHIGPSVMFLFFQACALILGAWCLHPFGIAAMAVCFTTASVLQTILAGRVSAKIVGQPSAQFWASAAFDRGFLARLFPTKERT
jgi:O-antigen/teichoic acid export membrane protein